VDFTINPVNDPPSIVGTPSPANQSKFTRGDMVTFSVEVYDPDIELGQPLIIVWSSSISGEFMTLTSNDILSFTTDELPVGSHTINVTVTDGSLSDSESFEIIVKEEPGEEQSFITSPTSIALIIIIVLVVIGVVIFLMRMKS
jgi:hypothetical protein